MRAALRDVAERAGVSTSTASRVLNNINVRITPETQQRVRTAAVEIGYQPNRVARALANNRMQTMGLWTLNLRSAYSSRVIYNLSELAITHDFDLMVGKLSTHPDGSIDTSKITSWPVDGMLMVDVPGGALDGLCGSLLDDMPVVSMGGVVADMADHVRIDFGLQATEAVRHLHDMGCARISYLMPMPDPRRSNATDTRFCGYQTAMSGLSMRAELIVTVDESREAAALALRKHIIRNGHMDGLLCIDDNMALGASHALRELGFRIPGDVALVSCCSTDGAFIDPQLTTIESPVEKMCSTAYAFLSARIKNVLLPIQHATFMPRLDIRGSSLRL